MRSISCCAHSMAGSQLFLRAGTAASAGLLRAIATWARDLRRRGGEAARLLEPRFRLGIATWDCEAARLLEEQPRRATGKSKVLERVCRRWQEGVAVVVINNSRCTRSTRTIMNRSPKIHTKCGPGAASTVKKRGLHETPYH